MKFTTAAFAVVVIVVLVVAMVAGVTVVFLAPYCTKKERISSRLFLRLILTRKKRRDTHELLGFVSQARKKGENFKPPYPTSYFNTKQRRDTHELLGFVSQALNKRTA